MIGFRFSNGEYLELPERTSIQIAGDNPIFNLGSIPGERIYNFKVSLTNPNRINLGFAEQFNLVDKNTRIDGVTAYLHKTPWKKGTLRIRKATNEGFDLSFHVDTSSLAIKITDVSLSSIDFGSEAVNLVVDANSVYPNVNHVFFPVYNPGFYEEDKNAEYGLIVNDFANVMLTNSNTDGNKTKYPITPFPYLVYILEKLFTELGYYSLIGDWINEDFIRRVVIYNNQSLDSLDGNGVNVWSNSVNFNNHLPDMTISDFLIEVCTYFGVFPLIDDKENTVEFVKIKNVLSDQFYSDYNGRASQKYEVDPNDYSGLKFVMNPDSTDRHQDVPHNWMNHKVDDGGEKIEVNASTLSMRTPAGTHFDTAIPYAKQLGISDEFEQSDDNRCGLRFLVFRGMTQDNNGDDHPRGHYMTDTDSLRWKDDEGLVNKCYNEFVELKKSTEAVNRAVRMNITEYFNFNMNKKLMIDNVKYLVKSYRARILKDRGIEPVECVLQKVIL